MSNNCNDDDDNNNTGEQEQLSEDEDDGSKKILEYNEQAKGGSSDTPGEEGEQDNDDDDEEEIAELDRYWPPPVDQSLRIVGSPSGKTISALAFNTDGTRFAAGGHDHEVRIWDFDMLDRARPEPIGVVQPSGQTIIKHLEFSHDDELILVISGSCQAVVIAKDGSTNGKKICSKGDQYIADMSNTKGHVQMLNDGCWNPKDKSSFITCSNDATIRIWDLNNVNQQKTVIKTRSPVNGLKSIPSVCRFSRDSLSIVTGCNDGSVMFWDTRRKFISTSGCIKGAHLRGSEITGLDYNYAMTRLCTRSEDESCKVWDLRQLKQAVGVRTGLPTSYSGTDCSFSPDDKFVLTGTSCGGSNNTPQAGQLHFLDSVDLTTQSCVDLEPAGLSAIRSRWHPKINHIAYSCTQGCLWLAYDLRRSSGGGLAVAQSAEAKNRGLKRKKYISSAAAASCAAESTGAKRIVTPHALPLFRDTPTSGGSSSFAKLRQDPRRSYRPEMPASGGGAGGTVRPAGSTLSSYIARNIARPLDDGSVSIRDRILRHASGDADAHDDAGTIGGRARQPPAAAGPGSNGSESRAGGSGGGARGPGS